MTTDTHTALAKIRAKLGLSRLDPRRLYLIDDGAYTWIGDRADLSTADARALQAIDACGRHPDRASLAERAACNVADYDAICNRCDCLSASHGAAGVASWEDLPESWRDGSALGPISPLAK